MVSGPAACHGTKANNTRAKGKRPPAGENLEESRDMSDGMSEKPRPPAPADRRGGVGPPLATPVIAGFCPLVQWKPSACELARAEDGPPRFTIRFSFSMRRFVMRHLLACVAVGL